MTQAYILDGEKNPVPVDFGDPRHVAMWSYEHGVGPQRRVDRTTIGDVRVSTVFLGVDHGHGSDRPILFETMIFGGERHEEQRRYCTWQEAEEGHRELVDELRQGDER